MKVKRFIKIFIILIFGILLLGTTKSFAAGSFSLSKSSVSLKKGKTTTFKINLKNCEGRFDVSSSNTKVATVSPSIVDGFAGGNTTVTIKAVAKGTATITIKASDVTDTSAKEVTGSKTIKVTVTDSSTSTTKPKPNSTTSTNNNTTNNSNNNDNNNDDKDKEKPKVSTDATLKNLGITPLKYDFSGFRKMTTSYSISVPNDVEKISIYGETNDSKAKVTGTGSKKLSEGKNTFSVKVTAEDKKTTKTYKLTITREKEEIPEEKPTEENTDNETEEQNDETQENPEKIEAGLTNLQISNGTLSPTFSADVHEYTITVPIDTKSLDIKTEKQGENVVVDIAGNENLKQGENVITLLVRNGAEDATTYQIVATVEESKIDLTEVNSSFNDTQKGLLLKKIILISIIIIIVILIIVFLIQRYKIQNESKEENDDITNNDSEEIEESKIEDEEIIVKRKKKGNHFK